MIRKVLIDGQEVDLRQVIEPQTPGASRIQEYSAAMDHAAADEFAKSEEVIDKIAFILELRIHRNFFDGR